MRFKMSVEGIKISRFRSLCAKNVPQLKPQWIEGKRKNYSICRDTSKVSRIIFNTPVVNRIHLFRS